jgi:hypothetical protein
LVCLSLNASDVRLAPLIGLAARQFTAPAQCRAPRWFGETLNGIRMTLGTLALIKAVVLHASLLDRLDDTEIGFASAFRAAEGLSARIDVVQARKVQARVTPANIASQPHLPHRSWRARER